MAFTVLDIFNEFRDRVGDRGGTVANNESAPYAWQSLAGEGLLWKNREVMRYLNRSREGLWLRKRGLYDYTTYTLSVVAGTRSYAYSGKILAIERIRRSSDDLVLTKTVIEELDRNQSGWSSTTATGSWSKYVEDAARRTITLDRIPSTTDTLHLVVRCLPTELTVTDYTDNGATEMGQSVTFVDDQDREPLLLLMEAQAYRKREIDQFEDPIQVEARADRMVGPLPSSRALEAWRQNANLTTINHAHPYSKRVNSSVGDW